MWRVSVVFADQPLVQPQLPSKLYVLRTANHSFSQFGPLSLDADELVVTASRDLPGNTEISINYVGDLMFASRAERQAGLEKWKFLCRCDICSLTSQVPAGGPSTNRLKTKVSLHFYQCSC